ncbi:MAG: DNA adenine methylase, partial [Bryobacteraceae bacterium]
MRGFKYPSKSFKRRLMASRIPHPIPYQGSKRRLAALILSYVPKRAARMIEPFAGSAAVTLAASARSLADEYVIGDSLAPLAELWKNIIEQPEALAEEYEAVWNAQLKRPRDHYQEVRGEFNKSGKPVQLLYLMARCVKNAVR